MPPHPLAGRLSRPWWALVLAWALSGCSSESLLKRIVRAPDDAYARTFFDSVRLGRTEYAAQRLSPRLWQLPGVRDSLVLLSTHLPHGAIDSMHIVGANRFTNGSVDQSALTYEYHSAQGWGVVTIDVSHELDLRYIDGIRADTLAGALESLNAFTLRGKGGGHYLMLVMWLACAGTTITACVRVLRTPMPRRWLWALFSLVGTGVFAFNWTTGQTGFALLSVRLFVGAVHAVPAAPWILSISFPIGAILALRRVQQARTAPPPVTSAPVSAPAEALPTVIPASSISLGSDGGATPT